MQIFLFPNQIFCSPGHNLVALVPLEEGKYNITANQVILTDPIYPKYFYPILDISILMREVSSRMTPPLSTGHEGQ